MRTSRAASVGFDFYGNAVFRCEEKACSRGSETVVCRQEQRLSYHTSTVWRLRVLRGAVYVQFWRTLRVLLQIRSSISVIHSAFLTELSTGLNRSIFKRCWPDKTGDFNICVLVDYHSLAVNIVFAVFGKYRKIRRFTKLIQPCSRAD